MKLYKVLKEVVVFVVCHDAPAAQELAPLSGEKGSELTVAAAVPEANTLCYCNADTVMCVM